MTEKKEVLLTITGWQLYGTHSDKMELTTVGCLAEDENTFRFLYEEEQEPPESPVRVRVTVRKQLDEVRMERSGGSHSCLLIRQGTRAQCRYGTEYGDLIMGLYGKEIKMTMAENEGTFYLRYVVDFNGQVSSRNIVRIQFKEKLPAHGQAGNGKDER